MRACAAFGRVFATLALVAAFAAEAPAQHAACIQDGEIVTFDGVATSGARIPNASRSAWVLNLRRPICVLRNIPFSPGPIQEAISAIRIIGTPPPLGVPLQLTGKLLLGRSAPDATLFVALEVIHGRKIPAAVAEPPSPSVLPPAAVSRARSVTGPPSVATRSQLLGTHCDAPPYGGTQTDYQAFVQHFGRIVKPEKILAGICNAKFGNSPRDGLHKLGFTDARIDSESPEKLAAETIVALKNLVNTIE